MSIFGQFLKILSYRLNGNDLGLISSIFKSHIFLYRCRYDNLCLNSVISNYLHMNTLEKVCFQEKKQYHTS